MNGARLPSTIEQFVLQWGEMGTHWGINRTVAQIHALLYLSEKPLDAAAISETLGIARSNASTSLRELQNWGIVRTVPSLEERRDRFETVADPWEMFSIIMKERMAREIDPTLRIVRECAAELSRAATPADRHARTRVNAMVDAFEAVSGVMEEILRLSPAALRRAAATRGTLRTIFKLR